VKDTKSKSCTDCSHRNVCVMAANIAKFADQKELEFWLPFDNRSFEIQFNIHDLVGKSCQFYA
jgi:hypothetical protein